MGAKWIWAEAVPEDETVTKSTVDGVGRSSQGEQGPRKRRLRTESKAPDVYTQTGGKEKKK